MSSIFRFESSGGSGGLSGAHRADCGPEVGDRVPQLAYGGTVGLHLILEVLQLVEKHGNLHIGKIVRLGEGFDPVFQFRLFCEDRILTCAPGERKNDKNGEKTSVCGHFPPLKDFLCVKLNGQFVKEKAGFPVHCNTVI